MVRKMIKRKSIRKPIRKKVTKRRITGLGRSKSMFGFPPKSAYRAEVISIKTPEEFRESIRILLSGKYTVADQRALQLAKNRAIAQMKRPNISTKEYIEFAEIAKIKIPKANTSSRPKTKRSMINTSGYCSYCREKRMVSDSPFDLNKKICKRCERELGGLFG